MNTLLQQLQKDFGEWGSVLSASSLFTQDDSPFKRISSKGFTKENSRLVFCVCSDDINRLEERTTIENAVKKVYNGEFHLGTLAAYPIGGATGITAGSHHAPEKAPEGGHKHGNLIFVICPHIGLTITETEILYGQILRPGQHKLSNCCGAMMGFLKSLRHAKSICDVEPVKGDENDPAKTLLFKGLLEDFAEDVDEMLQLFEMNSTIIASAKINYALVLKRFKEMLRIFNEKEHFSGHYAIIGGLTINTVKEDYFIFRDYAINSTE